jgi:tetratricopeptide (TPR) repeat protein
MPMYSDNLNQSAFFDYVEGNLQDAFILTQEGYRIGVAIGSPWGQVFGLANQGTINFEWGEYAQAQQNLTEAIRLGKDGAFKGGSGIAAIYLTFMYLDLGAVEQAVEAATFAQEAVQVLPIFLSGALDALAYALSRQGKLEAAVEYLEQARERSAKIAVFTFLPLILAEGEVGLAQENYDGVIEHMDNFLRHMESRGLRSFRADALYYKGRARLARGELELARETMAHARAEATALGSRRSLWRILIALWEIERARGNVTEAEQARAQAREAIEYIAAHAPEELRDTFLNLPQVQSLVISR